MSLALSALVLVLVGASPGAPAAHAELFDCHVSAWGCTHDGYTAHQAGGEGQGVVVVGDSLTQWNGPLMADELAARGFRAFTIGAGGYAYWHWNTGQAEHLDIGDYVTREHARHVVLALGTNDGRLLAAARVQRRTGAPHVTEAADHSQLQLGLRRAELTAPGCVIVVLPTTRAYRRELPVVRADLVELVRQENHRLGRTKFVAADWDAYSHAHEDWFAGRGNVHLSPLGNQRYADFITRRAVLARAGTLRLLILS